MNTPISWLKAYVPELACTDKEYNDRMTMTGTKVDGVAKIWKKSWWAKSCPSKSTPMRTS